MFVSRVLVESIGGKQTKEELNDGIHLDLFDLSIVLSDGNVLLGLRGLEMNFGLRGKG
jgi:hypothetical protein